jgi:uncharacterized protein
MAEFTIPNQGEVCWRELATTDLAAAKNFYRQLLGWKLEQSKVTEFEYPEIHVDDKATGGMIQITKEWGDPLPRWTTYIAVDDIQATVEKIKQFGGSVCVEPFDAPGVGRISFVNDPAGASFSVIQFAAQ